MHTTTTPRQAIGGENRLLASLPQESRAEIEKLPSLRSLLERYACTMISLLSQGMACNYLHPVEERICRWLLQVRDRVNSDEFQLTQQFLSWMLGVRRPTVTVYAGMLQSAGFITYRRGSIKILDAGGLERGACQCYQIHEAAGRRTAC